MSNYMDIYRLRVNRYGGTYKDKILDQRRKEFDVYLDYSAYRIDFTYNGETYPGTFERYKQDEMRVLHYLLTRTTLVIPNGTTLELPNSEGVLETWLVYYLEKIVASGYNRYIMLRVAHEISWTDRDGVARTSKAYLRGPGTGKMVGEALLGSKQSVYLEDNDATYLILATNLDLNIDDYIVINKNTRFWEGYRVNGYDKKSVEGVEFVTLDPTYLRDESEVPTAGASDSASDFFWFNGGEST